MQTSNVLLGSLGVPNLKKKAIFGFRGSNLIGRCQNLKMEYFKVAWRKIARWHNLLYTLPTLDFTFLELYLKILLLSKSKPGEMLLTGGRRDLSEQLLLVAFCDSGNFAMAKFWGPYNVQKSGFLGAKNSNSNSWRENWILNLFQLLWHLPALGGVCMMEQLQKY